MNPEKKYFVNVPLLLLIQGWVRHLILFPSFSNSREVLVETLQGQVCLAVPLSN